MLPRMTSTDRTTDITLSEQSEPKALALDLDGTTVDRRKRLHPRDRDAVAALQAHGVIVTIVTGRLYSATRAIAHTLGIQGPVGCMNGAEIVDTRTERALHTRPLPAEVLATVRHALRRNGLAPYLFAPDGMHLDERGAPSTRQMRSWAGRFVRHDCVFQARYWDGHRPVYTVGAQGRRTAVHAAAEAIRTAHEGLNLLLFQSGRGRFWWLEVRHAGDDKGTALHAIAEHHGVPLSQTVALGDWFNDAPLLRAAGRSFCMGHSPPPIQALCEGQLKADHDTGGGVAELVARVWPSLRRPAGPAQGVQHGRAGR